MSPYFVFLITMFTDFYAFCITARMAIQFAVGHGAGLISALHRNFL